jgi:hypothetical protein
MPLHTVHHGLPVAAHLKRSNRLTGSLQPDKRQTLRYCQALSTDQNITSDSSMTKPRSQDILQQVKYRNLLIIVHVYAHVLVAIVGEPLHAYLSLPLHAGT